MAISLGPQSSSTSDGDSYSLCSASDSMETQSNLSGAGRIIGNGYSLAGRRLENGLSAVAVFLGRGPGETAMKIRRLVGKTSILDVSSANKIRKAGKKLGGYAKYVISS